MIEILEIDAIFLDILIHSTIGRNNCHTCKFPVACISMDLEISDLIRYMRCAHKETMQESQQHAIWQRYDCEDHVSHLQEFMANRGIPLPQSNVVGTTQTPMATSSTRGESTLLDSLLVMLQL